MRIYVTVLFCFCSRVKKKAAKRAGVDYCSKRVVAHLLILKATERGGRAYAAFEQPWQWSAFAKKRFPAS